MGTFYKCKGEGRRQAVHQSTVINGIDYLEVQSDQTMLDVHFLHPLPGPGAINAVPNDPAKELTANNIIIEGGARISGIKVKWVDRADDVLTVTVDVPGDFSTYTLRLVKSPIDLRPLDGSDGFDPQLAAVEFSFKVDCPSEFDCASRRVCPPGDLAEPEIDYLAKDYASFRRLMLDRLSMTMPGWQETSPADLQIALVELLAYTGDHLSYYQDAVATEAYLGTAHKRVSVRRHARLLDYFMHDGCNARTWVVFTVEQNSNADGLLLEAGKNQLLSRGREASTLVDPDSTKSAQVLAENSVVFETMLDVKLYSAHNEIKFYTWSDSQCCLPRGSTRATLLDTPKLSLQKNDFLLFEEVLNPTNGLDADPAHRHVVRLIDVIPTTDPLDGTPIVNIAWHEEDALPFPLCLSAVVTDESKKEILLPYVSVARGNVTLADHGLTYRAPQVLIPSVVPKQGNYRPRLALGPLTYRAAFDDQPDPKSQLRPAASSFFGSDVRKARPVIELNSAGLPWKPSRRADLLSSDEFALEFVVELESDGVAYIRFGDNVHGRRPAAGQVFEASRYRIGNGAAGNIGAETLTRVAIGPDGSGISCVRNPLPARGGMDLESMEEVRQFAPQAFRRQERAVTEADYAEVAQRHPEVQRAAATLRWTGSWYTMFITIDRMGGRSVDAAFEQKIREFIERYRLAGCDVEIDGPIFVPLDILMKVCVKPGYFRSHVKKALLDVFSNRDLPLSKRAFFHPDNFTFGQPVYLSQLYEAAMSIAGVQSVDVVRFQRWGRAANQELENGLLRPDRLEVVRLDNDPNFAENGRIEFDMHGGM